MQISELTDFPAIQQIRDALWKTGDVRGAAVMVGAGFSRLASLNDTTSSLPPLWRDFSNRMESQLYPNGKAPSDPLRLAQEYKAALGETALDGLIQSLIQDDKWEPSLLHETLLSLPWSDVLTTNWDTLLERTPLLETERTYDVVRTAEDIPRTRAPRIVKLHGSFPANRPFIFTEEDYRTYPRKFSSFVNLAQQVLLENELCLVGFSGDDPNFLQWAGWVRDNLRSASRKIRLVGVLGLSPSRREMLKQQNVTPIDLAPLVEEYPSDAKHSKAITIFLEWLATSKPADAHTWNRPSRDVLSKQSKSDATEPAMRKISAAWRQDRQNHPGWLVTPGGTQTHFRYETDSHYPQLLELTEKTDVQEKMRLLFELVCRHEIAFWPLNEQYAKAIQDLYSSGGEEYLLQQEKTRFCAFLYAEARRRWDWGGFDFWGAQLELSDDQQASAELLYGKALRAKQEFDLGTLDELIGKLSSDDPVWKMRQGMLYTFLYEDAKAAQCFQSALKDIRRRRAKDKQSIWLLSREAWATWIFQSAWSELPENDGSFNNDFGEWPTHYAQKKCDPWDYLSFLDRKTAEEFEKIQDDNRATTPLFNAGHYRNNSDTTHFSNHANVSALDLYVRVQETVGIPTRIGHTNLLSTRLERAFTPTSRIAEPDFFRAATFITDAEKKLMATAFNRVEVAKVSMDTIRKLAEGLRKATDFFLSKYNGGDLRLKSIDRVRRNIELISRLCVRMPPAEARTFYDWALKLCENDAANDWWLYKHIGNVLERCIEATPTDDRRDIADTAIFLPLSGERNANGIEHDWPELIDAFKQDDFKRPEKSLKWAARIEELIRAVRNGNGLDRDRAILRLRVLFKENLLRCSEKDDLAKAVWAKTNEEGGWPTSHSLYPFVFLELPEIVPGCAMKLFASRFIEKTAEGSVDVHLLRTLGGGLRTSRTVMDSARKHFPSILKACVNWKPRDAQNERTRIEIRHLNEADELAIANFLAITLLPEMVAEEISKEVKATWLGHLKNTDDQTMVATAFAYSRLFPAEVGEMVRVIRKAIYSRNTNKIAFGYHAVLQFIEAYGQDKNEVPKILISDVISTCESMRELGLHHALHVAVKFVEAGVVGEDDLLRLSETIELLWSDFTYDEEIMGEERMITLTLVRSECAKLAKALLQAGQKKEAVKRICEEAVNDSVPEVRFAV